MRVDPQTLQDLRILRWHGEEATIFDWANRTRTRGGERRLRARFERPLVDAAELRGTQGAVRFLAEHAELSEKLLRGSDWLALERYVDSAYAVLAHPNRWILLLDTWWLRLRSRDVLDQIRSGLMVTQLLLRTADRLLGELEELDPPPLLADWGAALREALDHPLLRPLLTGRELDRGAAYRVLALNWRLRELEYRPLRRVKELVYDLDSLRSLALATREHGLLLPEVLQEEGPRVEAEGLRHPLLDGGVGNPLSLSAAERLLFVTGPNMAGKSTYLRAAGVAVFLAQVGMGVPAARFRWTPLECLFSGIDTTDNLRLGESYFFREVRRVREIASTLAQGVSAFVVFDELFKGTNLKDATDACLAVLQGFLGSSRSLFLVASHLSEIAEEMGSDAGVRLAHFAGRVEDRRATFDYRLRDGVSSQRLGMLILEQQEVLELLSRLREPGRPG